MVDVTWGSLVAIPLAVINRVVLSLINGRATRHEAAGRTCN